MSNAQACSSSDQLRGLLLGTLSERESTLVSEHLAECASCQAKTESLAISDTLVDLFRETARQPPPALVAEIEEAIAQLRDQPSAEIVSSWHSKMSRGADPGVPPESVSDDVTRELSRTWRPPQAADEIGRIGSYRILRLLGAGGMGAVFLAEDTALCRSVALKMMRPRAAANPGATERFLREARAAAAIRHDHIITVYQVGEEAGVPFLAMEFLEGESLDDRLKRQSPLPIAGALLIGREIAEALAAAHAKGLLHRDIKPANVWLETKSEPEGKTSTVIHRVKLLDFGLARSVKEDVRLTSTGMILGTPSYMAPEQGEGDSVDARADLFALGVVLYRMTTGRLPFPGATPMEVLKSLFTLTPTAPRSFNLDIPKELSDLIERLMAKAAKDRPESAVQVAWQLTQIERALQRMNIPASTEVSERSEPQQRAGPPEGIGSATKVMNVATEFSGTGGGAHRPWRVALAGLGAMALFAVLIVTIATRNVSPKNPAANSTGEIDSVTTKAGIEDATNKLSIASHSATPQSVHSQLPVGTSKKTLFFQTPGFDQWVKGVVAMVAEQQLDAVSKKLMDLNPEFDGKLVGLRISTPEGRLVPKILDGVVIELGFASDHVIDISPLRALPGLLGLDCAGSSWQKGKLFDLSPLKGLKLKALVCGDTRISDLSPLREMPLNFLDCNNSQVADLSPASGLPLETLGLGNTNVSDLSPIADCPLAHLNCDETLVTDVSSLNGRSLSSFYVNKLVTDISPLKKIPLRHLWINFKPQHEPEFFRSIKSLETINGEQADVYCKAAEAYRLEVKKPLAFQTSSFDQWIKDVEALTAEQQVDAVSQKLQQLNPGFDGRVTPQIHNGQVIRFEFLTDKVTDISPVRALKSLQDLYCGRSPYANKKVGGLCDISPLHGMPLTVLDIRFTCVSDLSPLRGMRLTALGCNSNDVSDLSPLKGMPLATIDVRSTFVRDLSPLAGMPLTYLSAFKTDVRDLSPLQDLPLTFITLSFDPERHTKFLRSKTTLQTINDKPAAEFWRDVEREQTLPK